MSKDSSKPIGHPEDAGNAGSLEIVRDVPHVPDGTARARHNPLAGAPLVMETREPWEQRFGAKVPLEVEIGFGYGNFLLEHAARNPGIGLVGFEIRRFLVEHVERRAKKLGLENIAVLRGDARRLLPALFGARQLQAVHILFPDPWWKKRHKRRRLVDGSFVRLLHGLLEPGGTVQLRTDVLEYGEAMISTFEDGSGLFQNLEAPRSFSHENPLSVPSNRERRYLEAGTPVYRLLYRKAG